ncbi:tpp1 [Symbiodinium sp. CCMP2592]|nr:tpp1 [Symbiodinium sp. CCMP2592]
MARLLGLSLSPLLAASVAVERPPPVPSAWKVSGPAELTEELELTFALRQQNLDKLDEAFWRVSTPSSAEYGQHWSNEAVHTLTAPRPEHTAAVQSFLRRFGAEASPATPNGDFLVTTVTVEVAQKMLNASYVRLAHGSGQTLLRAPEGYELPPEVAAAVDFVAPTVHVPGIRRPPSQDAKPDPELFDTNSPKNLRSLYNVGDAEGKAPTNRMAVTAFLEQGYSEHSLEAFWKLMCGGITCGKGPPKLVGDYVAGHAGVESMLDIETITGVAGNVEAEFWGFAGRSKDNPKNEPFLKWLTTLSSTGDKDVPKVFSTSYGEDEGSWSYAAAQRLNVEFQKAGVRGISLLYASGDEGANCEGDVFVPEGPGSSPYVTAVGGTAPGKTWPKPGSEAEKAIGLSSGGFSSYWPMPDYQKDAVAAYLKNEGLPPKSRGYNVSGRAYPDISAQATRFLVIAGLPVPGVSGTSCASPTAAGVIALLNDLRLQKNASTLGFLNPLIYSHLSAFNDITEGSSSSDCGEGWPAKAGWDAVTGAGTPDYQRLAKVVQSLPSGAPSAATLVI